MIWFLHCLRGYQMGQKLQLKKLGNGELQHLIKISNLTHQVISILYAFLFFCCYSFQWMSSLLTLKSSPQMLRAYICEIGFMFRKITHKTVYATFISRGCLRIDFACSECFNILFFPWINEMFNCFLYYCDEVTLKRLQQLIGSYLMWYYILPFHKALLACISLTSSVQVQR